MQQVQVTKWGNSLGFRIPRGIADNMSIKAGDTLDISPANDGLLLKKSQTTKKTYVLSSILDSFPSRDEYPEIDFGKPQGEEIW